MGPKILHKVLNETFYKLYYMFILQTVWEIQLFTTLATVYTSMTEQIQAQLYLDLGNRIRKARTRAGFKQGTFAQMLGVSRASVVNIEKGRQRPPLHYIYEVAKLTGEELFELLPSRPPADTELKRTWEKKISMSTMGDTVSRLKLTNFMKEVTQKIESNEIIPKKD
jgi:DNA-binding XRE family transcriptional regulator